MTVRAAGGPPAAGGPVERRSAEARRGGREGWQQLTRRLGKLLNLIGYDFFTTNVTRLERGVSLLEPPMESS